MYEHPGIAGMAFGSQIFINESHFKGTKQVDDTFIHEFVHAEETGLAGKRLLHNSVFYREVIRLTELLGRPPHPSEIAALKKALEQENMDPKEKIDNANAKEKQKSIIKHNHDNKWDDKNDKRPDNEDENSGGKFNAFGLY